MIKDIKIKLVCNVSMLNYCVKIYSQQAKIIKMTMHVIEETKETPKETKQG
jgi:hypothetical protein